MFVVEFKKGEDPHLKVTGKYEKSSTPAIIVLSPNGEVVVIASGNNLYFYSTSNGILDNVIQNVYSGKKFLIESKNYRSFRKFARHMKEISRLNKICTLKTKLAVNFASKMHAAYKNFYGTWKVSLLKLE